MDSLVPYYILLAVSCAGMAFASLVFFLLVTKLATYYQAFELPYSSNPVGRYFAIRRHPDGKEHLVGKDIRKTATFRAASVFLVIMFAGFLLLIFSGWKLGFLEYRP